MCWSCSRSVAGLVSYLRLVIQHCRTTSYCRIILSARHIRASLPMRTPLTLSFGVATQVRLNLPQTERQPKRARKASVSLERLVYVPGPFPGCSLMTPQRPCTQDVVSLQQQMGLLQKQLQAVMDRNSLLEHENYLLKHAERCLQQPVADASSALDQPAEDEADSSALRPPHRPQNYSISVAAGKCSTQR